jgi:iron complex transport system substrate-binding protein
MKPRRIASLLASGTEIVCGLGLADRLVAISHECDYPANITDRPHVTRANVAAEASSSAIDSQVRQMTAANEALYEIDVERLAALEPDVIVTQAQCDVCAVRYEDVLEACATHDGLRHARVVALNPMTLADVLADIEKVGEATDSDEEARGYVATLRDRIDAVRQRTSQVPNANRPRAISIEWIDPVMVAANWVPELIDLAGGRSGLTQTGHYSTTTDWQDIVRFDPEVILVSPCGFDLKRTLGEAPALLHHKGWSDLTAVRNGRVYAVDGNAYFNRSGPRIVDTLEIIAHLIHSDFHPPPLDESESLYVWRKIERP